VEINEAAMQEMKRELYLVVDPMPGLHATLPKIKAALDGGVDVIQLWDHWDKHESHEHFVVEVCALAREYHVPVLVNEHWQWLQILPLDGVHFDVIPHDFDRIKKTIERPVTVGITCGNDMTQILWAIDNKFDYISFCSMFSSFTANSCELVQPEIIKQTRALTRMPIYAAGGITCDNIATLLPLGINGVAIASGIMKAENPELAAKNLSTALLMKSHIKI
jgi:thiamine-phosphate pyrophosphorylase